MPDGCCGARNLEWDANAPCVEQSRMPAGSNAGKVDGGARDGCTHLALGVLVS